MKAVKLTHANIQDTQVYADLDLVVFWYFSPASNATHLVATAGAVMPVKESVEQITNLKGEKKNGRKA